MTFLSTLLTERKSSSTTPPVYLLQSSAAQSALPLLRGLIDAPNQKNNILILISSLYTPKQLLLQTETGDDARILDWTGQVRGYEDEGNKIDWKKRLYEIRDNVKESRKPVTVVFDSVDTIEEDIESHSAAYKLLLSILSSITERRDASQLILHITSLSPVLPLLKTHSFSRSLTHLIVHPPILLKYLSSTYLVSPPLPSSSESPTSPESLKFWSLFTPFSERVFDVERLVFSSTITATSTTSSSSSATGSGISGIGPNGDNSSNSIDPSKDEIIVEIIHRSRSSFTNNSGSSRRNGVEHTLEGWSIPLNKPLPLQDLASLKSIWRRKVMPDQEEPDPTKNLTFNLNLTDSQQASRSQVPLPYEHDSRTSQQPAQSNEAHIFYDPDSADDLDDEDPDEDLDL
ncbi:hypothetical protein PNOK_0234900 [Pyrrhoderma noxium]|uniref:Elongator complex protein 5 n=1 Tax=Pyrrhoderma noxium TaxID=2282107 RepID=A0A286US75_9AGAM|nr:hypothetical protein PNOK_0234900 [Pyrrhoderma noxium]